MKTKISAILLAHDAVADDRPDLPLGNRSPVGVASDPATGTHHPVVQPLRQVALLTRLGEALAASRAQGRRESASQACHAAALSSYAMSFGHQCK
jgi:hypothetical protein